MKRLPARCAAALCAAAAIWPAFAQSPTSDKGGRYEQFMAYPHRQAGYAAQRAGDGTKAIAEFARARALAPHGVESALDLVEAYRRFGHPAQARAVLAEQSRYTPNDPRLRAAALPPSASVADCRRDNRPTCRAQRGFADLRMGDLAHAVQELDAPDFAHSREQAALRHALVQRAIHLGDDRLAIAQLAELDARGALDTQERNQWFTLLLGLDELDAARELQARIGLEAPAQQLAMAQAFADRRDVDALAAYLASHQPAFADERAERQWVNLLAQAGRRQPAPLDRYVAHHPATAALQARLALALAMARGDRAVARRMLSRLPADRFREERFALALDEGRYAEATAQARLLVAQPGDERLLDPLSYRLLAAGADTQATQLLLERYPFAGDPRSALLFDRLALLADRQPALFSLADRRRLQEPLQSLPLRVAQARILGALHDCAGVRAVMADLSPDYPAAAWRQLGECYGHDQPGLAEYAYLQALRHGSDEATSRALAYRAYDAQDYATAMEAWRAVPPAHLQAADLLAAATTAITAHQLAPAHSWLDTYAARRGKQDDTYWWLRAQADEPDDPSRARGDLARAIALRPEPRYYARLAELQDHAGEASQALASWQRAASLAPDDGGLAAALGYAYLRAGAPGRARESFERAHEADPDDLALTRQLLYVNAQLGDIAQARRYAEQAIDQLDQAGAVRTDGSDGLAPKDEDELFALRRTHESLGRRWRIDADMSLGNTLASAANAAAPGVSYRSYAQLEAQYRLEPSGAGGNLDTLAAYARVFAGSGATGSVWPVHETMLGAGVHWKPWIAQDIVLSVEQQTPAEHSRFTRNDTLLRASGSWSFGPQLDDDWHASGQGWLAQNFYVDFAHYLRAEQSVLTLDYRLGLHRKVAAGQTVEPYVHVQYTGIDRADGQGFAHDGRAGVGVQWNLWYGQTRYDAYAGRFSLALEAQHAFTSYLRERNAVFLIVRSQW